MSRPTRRVGAPPPWSSAAGAPEAPRAAPTCAGSAGDRTRSPRLVGASLRSRSPPVRAGRARGARRG
eukprot:5623042-Prymnesium_polylepis.1